MGYLKLEKIDHIVNIIHQNRTKYVHSKYKNLKQKKNKEKRSGKNEIK